MKWDQALTDVGFEATDARQGETLLQKLLTLYIRYIFVQVKHIHPEVIKLK